jgi:YidC/Oxa1 family membrane protein insertase
MMNEIKEKYKDDPQKMNQQVMRLYKEYGVNPAGGCLPMLLQLPILYALWAVFSSTIELRQASFIWWIKDLSIPDVIVTLPFRLPLFGVNDVSGLALFMGITMFVQQKMSVKDPRQQAMVWIMPVLMTLMFNNFPAGLNLYYFVFNLLSIGQQMWINKQHKDEPLRKVEPGKSGGGFISKIAKNLPKTPPKR